MIIEGLRHYARGAVCVRVPVGEHREHALCGYCRKGPAEPVLPCRACKFASPLPPWLTTAARRGKNPPFQDCNQASLATRWIQSHFFPPATPAPGSASVSEATPCPITARRCAFTGPSSSPSKRMPHRAARRPPMAGCCASIPRCQVAVWSRSVGDDTPAGDDRTRSR